MNFSARFFNVIMVVSAIALIIAIILQIVAPDSPFKFIAALAGIMGFMLPRHLIKHHLRKGTWRSPIASENESDVS
jgi:hypothetical protein